MVEARQFARRSVEIDAAKSDPPGRARLHLVLQLAATLDRTGDNDGAIACLREVVTRSPRHTRGHRSMLGILTHN